EAFWAPLQEPVPPDINKRWPYSSSYQVVPASYDRENRISQGGTHRTYSIPGTPKLGNTLMTSVAFPSGKVHMHDSHQRHFSNKEPRYYAFPDARMPLMFFDGSVRTEITA